MDYETAQLIQSQSNFERSKEMQTIIRKGLEYLGGRLWRCVKCKGTVEADCRCCEPPSCNCSRKVKQ
jgi:hypothetical protein